MIKFIYGLLTIIVTLGQSISSICSGNLAIDLPKRHLNIQLVQDGVNATESLGDISHFIEAPDGCRYYSRVVDHGDGSYIFELRIHTPCPEMKITLAHGGHSLCSSPIWLKKVNYCQHPPAYNPDRPLLPESCNCPISLENWVQEAECGDEPPVE